MADINNHQASNYHELVDKTPNKQQLQQQQVIVKAPTVESTLSEGDCLIESVIGLRRTCVKIILFSLLCICSAGLFALLAHWIPRWRKQILYEECDLSLASHYWVKNWDQTCSIVVRTDLDGHICFQNRYLRYELIQQQQQQQYSKQDSKQYSFFRCVELQITEIAQLVQTHQTNASVHGLSQTEVDKRLQFYGKGGIDLEVPSYARLFTREILHPFFILQIYAVLLWTFEHYYLFACIVFTVTLISAIVSLVLVRRNYVRLSEMARIEIAVQVVRDGGVQTLKNSELVPGDILILEDNLHIPCDCLLLSGSALINESCLTGESVSVFKTPFERNSDFLLLSEQQKLQSFELPKKNTLFSGTVVVQAHSPATALVVRTAFSTLRGQLIRSILYPKPPKFRFLQESVQFICVLGAITLVAFLFVIPTLSRILSGVRILYKFLDLVTIAVPPQLSLALQVGISFALSRLEQRQISCTAPAKVVAGGMIDTVCFDKTGTLTTESMVLRSILTSQQLWDMRHEPQIVAQYASPQQLQSKLDSLLLDCFAACHSLAGIAAEGDAMESELFTLAGGKIIQQTGELTTVVRQLAKNDIEMQQQEQELHILKRFDFSSEAQCMSVVAHKNDVRWVFSKGAPERIAALCLQVTVPKVFEAAVTRYAKDGYRVLAFAYRPVSNSSEEKLERGDVERDLRFLGIAIFENPLKEGSQHTIQELTRVNIRSVMLTGDNHLTATQVAHAVGILLAKDKIAIVRAVANSLEIEDVYLEEMGLNQQREDQYDLEQTQERKINVLLYRLEGLAALGYCFVLTGAAFAFLTELELSELKYAKEVIPKVFAKGRVFARMRPNQKTQLIDYYQTRFARTVAMVGDGANDCGALKQADVGLSLSPAEASISAPFTSKDLSAASLLTLLIQCRAGLATAYQTFKFMALYAMIQFTSTIICYNFDVIPAEMQFLFQDLALSCTLTVSMSFTEAADLLSIERPPQRLMGLQCILSIGGAALLQAAGQIFIIQQTMQQPFYITATQNITQVINTSNDDFDNLPQDSIEATVLFVFSYILYLACVAAFSIGPPFRKPFYTNTVYTMNFFALLGYELIMLYWTSARLPGLNFSGLIPNTWLISCFGQALLWAFALYLYEQIIIVWLFSCLQRKNE